MKNEKLVEKYTEEQRVIIQTKNKHVEVLAYPGTGKSFTLCGRVNWLLDQGIRSNQILVLTFSNAAVDILINRLDKSITVQTFHAFANSIVRQRFRNLGMSKKPQLITPDQKLTLVRKAIKNSPDQWSTISHMSGINLRNKQERKRLTAFYTKVSGDGALAKSLVADPNSEFQAYRKVLKPLSQIHRQYRDIKEAAGVMDYADMLLVGRTTLEQGQSLPYKYLFIDECQDMSRGQAEILRVLATLIPNVMVFGDPYQGVFGFAGGRYRKLSTLMENVRQYSLTQSFRLTQRTADLASALLAPLSDEPVRLIGRKPGLKPKLICCKTLFEQTKQALAIVRELDPDGKSNADIAVLARTKAQLREVEIALLGAGYPIQQRYRLAAPEHMDKLLDILELLEKCAKRIADRKKICPKKLERRILRTAGLEGTSICPKVIAACRRKLCKATLSPTLEGRFIGARKVYEKLLRQDGSLTVDIRAELGRWEPLISRFVCAADVRAYICALRKRPAVTTSTIHRAKGGEWDNVLLLGVTEGSLPFFREIERGELDEERRLLYVAASRPKDRLFLFQAPYYHALSGKKYENPSRFLKANVRRHLKITNANDPRNA